MVPWIALLPLLLPLCAAFLPVVMLHGVSTNDHAGTAHDWDHVVALINEAHPGTRTFPLPFFAGVESLRPLSEQLPALVSTVQELVVRESLQGGWIALGHSQGGLLMRMLAQSLDDHGIVRFVSLAGVQYGVYGLGIIPKFLGNLSAEAATDMFYTRLFQDELSVANYWHSPDTPRYVKDNVVLPVLNCEVPSSQCARWKSNFVQVGKGKEDGGMF